MSGSGNFSSWNSVNNKDCFASFTCFHAAMAIIFCAFLHLWRSLQEGGAIQKVVPSPNFGELSMQRSLLWSTICIYDYMILGNTSSQFLLKSLVIYVSYLWFFHTQGLYQCPVLHISVSFNQNETGPIFFLSPNYFGIILSAISSVVGNLTTINVRVFLSLCLAMVETPVRQLCA